MSVAVQNQERLLKIIISPHISEKAYSMADKYRQYVFRVLVDATKPEIKNAIEHLFEVSVESVKVCNVKGKQKRFGQITGRRKNIKKAYVKLKEGHKINFMDGE